MKIKYRIKDVYVVDFEGYMGIMCKNKTEIKKIAEKLKPYYPEDEINYISGVINENLGDKDYSRVGFAVSSIREDLCWTNYRGEEHKKELEEWMDSSKHKFIEASSILNKNLIIKRPQS